MSNDTIPARKEGQLSDASWFNFLRTVLSGDWFPRNTGAAIADTSGALGTSAYRWLRAYIASGYWTVGDIKVHHSYNGANPPGEGWMLCDGRIINQTNYDAEHGAGKWAANVGTSPIDGKYLPDFDNKYPIGSATTTQTGASPITTTGNAGHLSPVSSHGHKWMNGGQTTNGADNQYYDSNGSPQDMVAFVYDATNGIMSETAFVTNSSMYTNNGNTADVSIQPDSIKTQYYMRII